RHWLAIKIRLNTEFIMMFLDLITHRLLILFDGFFASTDEILNSQCRNIPLLEGVPLMLLVPLHDRVDPTTNALQGSFRKLDRGEPGGRDCCIAGRIMTGSLAHKTLRLTLSCCEQEREQIG